jgi:adenosylhomocysteine nucleosidase
MNDRRPAGDDDEPSDSGARESRPAPAPAPVAIDVGIVAALSMEVGFLVDKLENVRKYSGPRHTVIEGEVAGKVVGVIVTGMGREAARLGATLLLDGHHPRWLLSAGYAGALDPSLARNGIVMANEVIDLEGHRYAIDVAVPPPEGDRDRGPRIATGRLLTVDRIIPTAAEKAELRRRYEADLLDMETSAVAALCSARGLRFLSIRVISDEAGIDLPPEVVTLLTRSGSYRIGAALRAVWQRPSRIKEFWALHEHAQEAADRLARFTVAALDRLS